MPLSKLRIGYIKTEFERAADRARRGGRPRRAAAAGEGGGRGEAAAAAGSHRNSSGAQNEARLKMLNDALDVYRKAGATLSRSRCRPPTSPNTIGFILSVEAAAAFDDLTRSKDISDPSLEHLAEHVPHAPVRAGGRIHPRPARAHAADPRDGQADVAVRRVPLADQQPQPGPDQPDRPSGGRAAAPDSSSDDAGRDHDDGPALRRGHACCASRWRTSAPRSGTR